MAVLRNKHIYTYLGCAIRKFGDHWCKHEVRLIICSHYSACLQHHTTLTGNNKMSEDSEVTKYKNGRTISCLACSCAAEQFCNNRETVSTTGKKTNNPSATTRLCRKHPLQDMRNYILFVLTGIFCWPKVTSVIHLYSGFI